MEKMVIILMLIFGRQWNNYCKPYIFNGLHVKLFIKIQFIKLWESIFKKEYNLYRLSNIKQNKTVIFWLIVYYASLIIHYLSSKENLITHNHTFKWWKWDFNQSLWKLYFLQTLNKVQLFNLEKKYQSK